MADFGRVGNYILCKSTECGNTVCYDAVHVKEEKKYVCKVMPLKEYEKRFVAYNRVGFSDTINTINEIILGEKNAYIFFELHYGDLNQYARKHLQESEARELFRQIVTLIHRCHTNGISPRNIKLVNFVFVDEEKTTVRFGDLDWFDFFSEEDEDSCYIRDKHGCIAYVAPELLSIHPHHGQRANIWSLGVVLYALLCCRYPFCDKDPMKVFIKIRIGRYYLPNNISSAAKCLIKALIRLECEERLTTKQVLDHPWFIHFISKEDTRYCQIVPNECHSLSAVKCTCDEVCTCYKEDDYLHVVPE